MRSRDAIAWVAALALLSGCSSDSDSEGAAAVVASPPIQQPQGVNRAPTISGTPSTSVQATRSYSFTPTASDPDGNALTFQITNRPSWATTFNPSTGALSGIPSASQVGTYAGIVISVSDGSTTVSLPAFSIQVTLFNAAPLISGVPATAVVAGAGYQFQPSATDPEGSALIFSIQNQPSWVTTFNPATGLMSGTPTLAHVGTYSRVVISVSDGQLTTSLPAFDIVVTQVMSGTTTVSWAPPTTNTDGSALTNLAGYRLYYGTSTAQLDRRVDVSGATTSQVVNNLSSGTYYFAVTALSAVGAESDLSNIATKVVQ